MNNIIRMTSLNYFAGPIIFQLIIGVALGSVFSVAVYLTTKIKNTITHNTMKYLCFVAMVSFVAFPLIFSAGNVRHRIDTVKKAVEQKDIVEKVNMKSIVPKGENHIAESIPVAEYIVLIWILGVAISLTHMLGGQILLRRLYKIRDKEIEASPSFLGIKNNLGIKRSVKIYTIENISTPFSFGIFFPCIVIPDNIKSRNEINTVLTHEFVHIKNNDVVLLVLAKIVMSIFWFVPYLSILREQMRRAMEKAVDNRVLSLGVNAVDYSSTLLKFATLQKNKICKEALLMSEKSEVENRITNILSVRKRLDWKKCGIVLSGLALVFCSLLAGLAPLMAKSKTLSTLNDVTPKGTTFVYAEKDADTYIWPVKGGKGRISNPFGIRPNPFDKGHNYFHRGIDIAFYSGRILVASKSGKVILAGWDGDHGKKVKIEHSDGLATVYTHMAKINVKKGKIVKQGQKIGTIGTTGRSTGPHVHFEIIRGEKHMDPLELLINDGKILYR